jgi:hypothetical protein
MLFVCRDLMPISSLICCSFISFDDLQNLLGNSTEYDELEKIWRDSLTQCKSDGDRISYSDFKNLMKGQPKEQSFRSLGMVPTDSDRLLLSALPEEETSYGTRNNSAELVMPDEDDSSHQRYIKKKSRSHEFKKGVMWDELERTPSLAFVLSKVDDVNVSHMSPLVANRALYRKHRGMRLAVLEASKHFDKKRNERLSQKDSLVQPALVMKRGVKPPVELADAHTRALFDAASKRCGRSRRTRNRTVSDVTGMLIEQVKE